MPLSTKGSPARQQAPLIHQHGPPASAREADAQMEGALREQARALKQKAVQPHSTAVASPAQASATEPAPTPVEQSQPVISKAAAWPKSSIGHHRLVPLPDNARHHFFVRFVHYILHIHTPYIVNQPSCAAATHKQPAATRFFAMCSSLPLMLLSLQ